MFVLMWLALLFVVVRVLCFPLLCVALLYVVCVSSFAVICGALSLCCFALLWRDASTQARVIMEVLKQIKLLFTACWPHWYVIGYESKCNVLVFLSCVSRFRLFQPPQTSIHALGCSPIKGWVWGAISNLFQMGGSLSSGTRFTLFVFIPQVSGDELDSWLECGLLLMDLSLLGEVRIAICLALIAMCFFSNGSFAYPQCSSYRSVSQVRLVCDECTTDRGPEIGKPSKLGNRQHG